MYKELTKLRPYFFSLREVLTKKDEENKETRVICLDLKFPIRWEHNEIIKKYSNLHSKEQDKSGDNMLLTLMTTDLSEDGFKNIFNCGLEIIKYNKEEEEKQKLFLSKMDELKKMFEKETEKLKNEFKSKSLTELQEFNDIKLNEDK